MATCLVEKIDSNSVELRIAEEDCLGELPSVPVWEPQEPNSYDSFGVTTTLTARNPINSSRQRKKGVVTDLEASMGFETDVTQTSMVKLLRGAMFAELRTKPTYSEDYTDAEVVVTPGSLPIINVTGADRSAELVHGEWVYVTGFTNQANNGFKRLRSFGVSSFTVDKSDKELVAETGANITVHFGKVLKNELLADIKRFSFQAERTLGSLDGLYPPQSEYVVGGVVSEASINLPSADKMTASFTLTATNGEVRTQAEGLKPGTRPPLVEADAYNTSTDLKRIRLSAVSSAEAAPEPLFAAVLEASIEINNNVTGAKKLGKAGNFELTAGTFEVGGSLTAYFSDVRAVRAVQNNEDVTLDYILARKDFLSGKTTGIVIDQPMLALGDGLIEVEQDSPIQIPLTPEAASAARISSNMDYTLMFVFFDDLPEEANSVI